MALDAWLPVGYKLPDGAKTKFARFSGAGWQIVETQGSGHALLARTELAQRWVGTGLIAEGVLAPFAFGDLSLHAASCGPSQQLCPVSEGRAPQNRNEAMAFALALRETRAIDRDSPLQEAIYLEKLGRLLPTYGISSSVGDDVVLGYWLTGGAHVSAKSFRRLRQMLSWMRAEDLREVVEAAGFSADETAAAGERQQGAPDDSSAGDAGRPPRPSVFSLPGRPQLEAFFNEHVVDIVTHKERYRALGIDFPSAIVLHGPPGTGKTFAVEQLVEFLGWPSFQIDASSVASPYIHETSRKVAEMFDKAMESAPSVLVIDEMESFLADRDSGAGSSHHRVEEVAEFLRRIPEATKNQVLIVAMTNRVDMVDPAVLRRGRFDHVIEVGFASEVEVRALLDTLLADLPKEADVDAGLLAKKLGGRPLSDVAFVVREGARLAARGGRATIDQASLLAALKSAPARQREGGEKRRIGFI
jgi:hypothetical protein